MIASDRGREEKTFQETSFDTALRYEKLRSRSKNKPPDSDGRQKRKRGEALVLRLSPIGSNEIALGRLDDSVRS
jgi:hypothetical protein